jgi:tetratricopeptide (TPR) repeat protein
VARAIDEYLAAMETRDRPVRLERFARAEQLFRQVIEGDAQQPAVRNADLYVNLGNAALQAEHLGPAIAAYRRALALDPQHAQARQNLDYARSLLPDWARSEDSSHLIESLFFWRTMIPRGRLLVLGAGCFLLAAVLFAVGYAGRRPLLRNSAVVPLLVWVVLSASLVFGGDKDADRNVVVVAETTVYTADSENSAPRLDTPLPSGTELSLLEQRAQWSEIRLPDGHRTGWVLSSALERL